MGDRVLPAWLEADLIPDQDFGQAYESMDDRQRGWIKACLARLYDRHPPAVGWKVLETGHPRAGYFTLSHSTPLDFAIFLLPLDFSSPARLLAALLPALTAGVGEVLVAFLLQDAPAKGASSASSPLPSPVPSPVPALLTALELAGQERACVLTPKSLDRLLAHLNRLGRPGLLYSFPGLDAGVLPQPGPLGAGLGVAQAPVAAEAGVWLDDPDDFDLAALRFAHPDLRFAVFGPCPRLPDKGFSRRKGDMERFSASAFDAVYLSEERMGQYLGGAPLVLGPGQEPCWAWPGLSAECFFRPRLGWFTWQGDQGQS